MLFIGSHTYVFPYNFESFKKIALTLGVSENMITRQVSQLKITTIFAEHIFISKHAVKFKIYMSAELLLVPSCIS
jgi:hypothetical protein